MSFWLVLLAVSFLFVVYTYLGYPALLIIGARLFRRPVKKQECYPTVSLLIVAYNESRVIRQKMDNCLVLNYPKEKLEVVFATDGCSDETNAIISDYAGRGIVLKAFQERRGKMAVINRTVPQLRGDIVVFSDARQIFHPDAVKELVWNFADPSIGAVSGQLFLEARNKKMVNTSLWLYWEYEKRLRKREGEINSCVGVTGAIYAMRRELFGSLPDDMILDDVVIPLKVVEQGYRVIFEGMAKAYDTVSSSARQEYGRKTRTLAGNFQMLFSLGRVFRFNFNNNFVLFAYLSHKVTRIFLPVFFALFMAASFFIDSGWAWALFWAQVSFYICAILGLVLEKQSVGHWRVFHWPAVFCTLHFAIVVGFWRYITKHQKTAWERSAGICAKD